MGNQSLFKPSEAHRSIRLQDTQLDRMSVLLAAGLINPAGPTLAVLALEGPMEPGTHTPIVWLGLNPFVQEAVIVGEATIGDSWRPVSDLAPFLSGPLRGCPTLFAPSRHTDEREAIDLVAT